MTIKEFQEEHKEFCNRFNETLDLYYRCGDYIESPERSDEQIDKFLKTLAAYSKSLSLMMLEYETLAGEKMPNRVILGGFIFYENNYKSDTKNK